MKSLHNQNEKQEFKVFFNDPRTGWSEPVNVTVRLLSSCMIKELIHEVTIEFNALFQAKNLGVKFDLSDMTQFDLKHSKKDGRPKEDYPSVNKLAFLRDTKASKYTLICRRGALMLLSRVEESSASCLTSCDKCIVY